MPTRIDCVSTRHKPCTVPGDVVSASTHASAPTATPRDGTQARIGPNAVLQSLRALGEAHGDALRTEIARRARLPDAWPAGLIPEAWFVRLIEALRAELPESAAEDVLRKAGAYTAEYVAANRVPSLFRRSLQLLPDRWAVALLLAAFKRHAWTFAGSSTFSVDSNHQLVLADCPTCRAPNQTPGGAYYEAAFEGLLRLASDTIHVREVACRRQGAGACRFSVKF